VRQQNSGAVEDFILPYFRSLSTNPKVKELLKSVTFAKVIVTRSSATAEKQRVSGPHGWRGG